MQQENLMRSETDRMIAGVCGGLAAYLGVDPVWVRLAFVLLLFASGIGAMVYAILWVIMPVGSQVSAGIRIVDEMAGDDPAAYKRKTGSATLVGVILIALGGFVLLNQMGLVPMYVLLPLMLIGAGVYFIFRRAR